MSISICEECDQADRTCPVFEPGREVKRCVEFVRKPNPHAILIGLLGHKQHGKDSVFAALRQIEPTAQRIAFADPLYEEVADACNVTVEFIKAHKEVFRPMMQWWGTEFRRGIGGNDDYWIDRAKDALRIVLNPVIVFTDVRFPNEAKMIKERQGVLWRVVRPGMPVQDGHPSETVMKDYPVDRVIPNDGTLNRLRDHVHLSYLDLIKH